MLNAAVKNNGNLMREERKTLSDVTLWFGSMLGVNVLDLWQLRGLYLLPWYGRQICLCRM